jgi:hypothetical protein
MNCLDKYMIKNFFIRLKGPEFSISLIFLGLGLLVLVCGAHNYKTHSMADIRALTSPSHSEPEVSFERLHSMFASKGSAPKEYVTFDQGNILYSRPIARDMNFGSEVRFRVENGSGLDFKKAEPADFGIIAQNNLFSPDRKAWEPSPENEQNDEPATVKRAGIDPDKLKLYGITRSQDRKMALVHYPSARDTTGNLFISEGESVHLNHGGKEEAFRVVAISKESITVESAGDSFQIGLFSHQRQEKVASGTDRMSVVIGGTSEPVQIASLDQNLVAQAHSNIKTPTQRKHLDTSSSGIVETSPAQSSLQPGADQLTDESSGQPKKVSLDEFIQHLKEGGSREQEEHSGLAEDLERQVAQGTMRRVDTPFGPIYRPVR